MKALSVNLERSGTAGGPADREAAPLDDAAAPQPDDKPRLLRRWTTLPTGVVAVAGGVGTILGVVVTAVTAIFTIRPNVVPSTSNQAEIRNIVVEPDVTLDQYLRHWPVVRSIGDPMAIERFRDQHASELSHVGPVVHFEYEVTGLRRRAIAARWSLFDAETGRRLAESEDIGILNLHLRAEKKDIDIGTWEVWVDVGRVAGTSFFVRIELLDEDVGTRITFADAPPFARTS